MMPSVAGSASNSSQAIDEVHAANRVTTDTDARRLPEAYGRRLIDGLVGQGSRARYDADAARLVNKTRHDADLAFARRYDAGAIRADQPTIVIAQRRLDLHHVIDGNTLGYADDQPDAGIRCFKDRVRRKRRWHVDHADIGVSLVNGIADGIENRHAEVLLTTASRCHTGNDLRAVFNALLSVKRSLVTGDALAENFALFVNKNAHL